MAEPNVTLFWGEDEFLLRLRAQGWLAACGVRAVEVDGAAWQGGETSDLATPSLWGEPRALLVTGSHGLPAAGLAELRDYVGSPSPDAFCALTHVGRGKNPPPLAKPVQAGGGRVTQVALRRQDLTGWVMERAKVRGARLSSAGAAELVGRVGTAAAELDQAVEQLAGAFAGTAIGPEQVRAQFEGLGEQQVWDLCDQALTGRSAQALVTLRALLEAKADPLLILGGIASRVRDLIRVRAVPDGLPAAEAAKAAGLRFDWQLRRYREQARRFTPEELTWLHGQVAEADHAIKGLAPGDIVLPPLVAALSGDRQAAVTYPERVTR
jgi:DNA polymerase-3 subunit delta